MPATLSRFQGSKSLGLGVAMGVGISAAVSILTQQASKLDSDSENERRQIEALKKETASLKKDLEARRMELSNAQAATRKVEALETDRAAKAVTAAAEVQDDRTTRIEALKKAQDALQKAEGENAAFHAEVAQLEQARRQIEILQAEKAALKHELDNSRTTRGKPEPAERKVEALEKELQGARKLIDALKKAQAESDAPRLEKELQAARNQINGLKKAQAGSDASRLEKDLHSARVEIDALKKVKAENDSCRLEAMQRADASEKEQHALSKRLTDVHEWFEEEQRKVKALEKVQKTLQSELDATKRKRKDSMTDITRSLSGISAKLDSAETSWTPWKEINEARRHIEDIETVQNDTEGDDSLFKGA